MGEDEVAHDARRIHDERRENEKAQDGRGGLIPFAVQKADDSRRKNETAHSKRYGDEVNGTHRFFHKHARLFGVFVFDEAGKRRECSNRHNDREHVKKLDDFLARGVKADRLGGFVESEHDDINIQGERADKTHERDGPCRVYDAREKRFLEVRNNAGKLFAEKNKTKHGAGAGGKNIRHGQSPCRRGNCYNNERKYGNGDVRRKREERFILHLFLPAEIAGGEFPQVVKNGEERDKGDKCPRTLNLREMGSDEDDKKRRDKKERSLYPKRSGEVCICLFGLLAYLAGHNLLHADIGKNGEEPGKAQDV